MKKHRISTRKSLTWVSENYSIRTEACSRVLSPTWSYWSKVRKRWKSSIMFSNLLKKPNDTCSTVTQKLGIYCINQLNKLRRPCSKEGALKFHLTLLTLNTNTTSFFQTMNARFCQLVSFNFLKLPQPLAMIVSKMLSIALVLKIITAHRSC